MEPREGVLRIRELSRPLPPEPVRVRPRRRPLPGIRAVLFDVYGTLFVSACGEVGTAAPSSRVQALGEALAACGQPVGAAAARRAEALLGETVAEDHARSRRRGVEFPEVEIRDILRRVLEALAREGLLPGSPPEAAALPEWLERLALEHELRANPTWPQPGLASVLAQLRARGLALGIVSNAQFYTPWLFPAHLGADLSALGFEEGLCSWSYARGVAKPSRELFLPVLERLAVGGIDPGQILYVGNDRRNDVWPAAALGCRTALFAGDRRSYRPRRGEVQLRGVRPDRLLTDLRQLPPVCA